MSLSGTISTAPDPESRVDFDPDGNLDHTSFSPLSNGGERLEKYFAVGGTVNLYACNTGVSSVLPRGLAKDICRLVRAPSNTISYCPDINHNRITDRNWVYVEGITDHRERTCQQDRKRSFTSLLPFMREIEPDAKKNSKPLRLDLDLDDL